MEETLGQMVRRARDARRWTAKHLGERIGREQSWISRLEKDQLIEMPGPDVFAGLERELGLPQEAMLRARGYLGTAPEGDSRADAVMERVRAMDDVDYRLLLEYSDYLVSRSAKRRSKA